MSDILTQLKQLKNSPKAGAVSQLEHEAQKKRLLAAIGAEENSAVSTPSFVSWFFGSFISKPVAASAAAVVLAVGGLSTVSAAETSLPGDALYSVKKITEQAQLRLASLDRRAVLHTEFAERRLKEANELQGSGEPARLTLAKEALVAYKNELNQASNDLRQLKDTGDTPQTLAVVNNVQQKVDALETEIEKNNVPAGVENTQTGEEVQAAREATKEVQEVATTVVVDVHEEKGDEVTTQELKEMFQKDLGEIEARQTFDEHRLEKLRSIFKERADIFTASERVTTDDFKRMDYVIEQTKLQIPEVMNGFAAGGYRSAFAALRGLDAELLALEAKIAGIEFTVTEAMQRAEDDEDSARSSEDAAQNGSGSGLINAQSLSDGSSEQVSQ